MKNAHFLAINALTAIKYAHFVMKNAHSVAINYHFATINAHSVAINAPIVIKYAILVKVHRCRKASSA